jgi:hypothetical protein
MAYSPNSTNLLGRRALVKFFAGIGAAEIAGSAARITTLASTPGDPQADAQLFDRWREYVNSEIELNAAQLVRDRIAWNARQAYPPKPNCIGQHPGVDASELDINIESWAATTDMKSSRQPAAEHTDGLEIWVQKCNEINVRFGVPELEAAFKTAWDRQWAAFARFVATQATTLAGLALKTSAIFYFEDQTRRAWRGTVNEQKQLEPDQQILLTLRRDLLRIARLPDDFALEYAEAAEQYFSTAECW